MAPNTFNDVVVIIRNVTSEMEAEIQLEKEKELFKQILLSVGDGIIVTDSNYKVMLLNKSAEQLTQWEESEAIGKGYNEIFRVISESSTHGVRAILITKDLKEKYISFSNAPILDKDGNKKGVVIVFRDVTTEINNQNKIQYLSYHDQLTGLHNRHYLEKQLEIFDNTRYYPLTILMADVNGLKLVNDSFGHTTGDLLLRKVSNIFKKSCGQSDLVFRTGGDEFVVILPNTTYIQTEQLVEKIKAYASLEKVESIDISISFGWDTKVDVNENIQDILKKAEDHMFKKKLFEGPSMRGKTINTIINTLHEKNKREEQHSYRVSMLCQSMGKILKMSEDEIRELKTMGLLHDIGKVAIEESILNKPGKLTDEEWEEMKRHPEIGYRILSTVNDMVEMVEYVLAHHERWDGRGYPKGLKGEEIPLQARIISIADSFDAMTSERTYKKAMTEEAAILELEKNSGTQFDPNLVPLFVEMIRNKRYINNSSSSS